MDACICMCVWVSACTCAFIVVCICLCSAASTYPSVSVGHFHAFVLPFSSFHVCALMPLGAHRWKRAEMEKQGEQERRAEHAVLMREALVEARQQRRETAQETVESGELATRVGVAALAFGLVTLLRSPQPGGPPPDVSEGQVDALNNSSVFVKEAKAGARRQMGTLKRLQRSATETLRAIGWDTGTRQRSDGRDAVNASAGSSNATRDGGEMAEVSWRAADPLIDASVSRQTVAALDQKAQNFSPVQSYDYVIIGAGAAGRAAAAMAWRLGVKTVVIDEEDRAGASLLDGSVPSKALLHEASRGQHAAANQWQSPAAVQQPPIEHHGEPQVRDVEAASQEPRTAADRVLGAVRSRQLASSKIWDTMGTTLVEGRAEFESAHRLRVTFANGTTSAFEGRKFLVCTGAEPATTGIRGLANAGFWTYQTVLRSPPTVLPRSLVVIGGGPVGCELAQAFARLGTKVTLVAPELLPREAERAQAALADVLVNTTGVRWVRGRAREVLRRMPGELTVLLEGGGHVAGAKLLVATGRKARTRNLGLGKAGVLFSKEGIYVDDMYRTSAPHIMAAGDCCLFQAHPTASSSAQMSEAAASEHRRSISLQKAEASVVSRKQRSAHAAGWHGERAARIAWMGWWLRLKAPAAQPNLVPRVVYTRPEVAAVGLTEEQVVEKYGAEGGRWWRVCIDSHGEDSQGLGAFGLGGLDRSVAAGETSGAFVDIIFHRHGCVCVCVCV